jgi:hypothetical protein
MSDAIIVAFVVTLGTIITSSIGALALVQSTRTHKLINSRMDELLDAAREVARAEGLAAGEQAERDRNVGGAD